jgi:hypothetical protein
MRIGARGLQRRQDAEGQRDQRADRHAEAERGRVDRDCADPRQIGRAEGDKRAHADERDANARRSADCREHQAFGEQLPDEAAAPGSEGGPQRELGAAVNAPRQQQVR